MTANIRKECPFCQENVLGIGWGQNKFDGDFCQVHCRTCFASGPKAETEDEAWQLWGDRTKKETDE